MNIKPLTLTEQFAKKFEAFSLEFQKVFNECIIKKMKPRLARTEAFKQTKGLADRIRAMPSTQMYFDELRGSKP